MATALSPLRRLRTAADPTLFDVPSGRWSVRTSTRYGDVQVTNPNLVPPTSSLPGAVAPPPVTDAGAPEIKPPLSPDVTNAGAPPAENATLAEGSNIIEADFQAQDSEAVAAEPDWGQQIQVENQRHMDAIAAAHAQIDAIEQPPEQQAAPPQVTTPAANPTQPRAPKRTFADFKSDVGKPIEFGGRAPWKQESEVAFNTGMNDRAAAWTPHSSMDGPYESAGTPDTPHKWSQQTERFYQRLENRGTKNDIRRVDRYNARRGA